MLKKNCRFTILAVVFFVFAGTLPSFGVINKSVNKIVAVVNGEMITQHDLNNYVNAELARQNISRGDPKATEITRNALDMMINDILIRLDSQNYRISIGNAEVDAEFKRFAQGNNMTPEAFTKRLTAQGLTVDQFKEKLKDNMLRQRMITFMIARKIVVTRDEVKVYYEQHKKQFTQGTQVDFSVIIFDPSVKADQIYKQIRTGKITFAEAAKKYSVEAAGREGGHVGLRPLRSLPPFLQQKMQGMQPGEISGLFQVDKTKGLLLVHSFTQASEPVSLEEATPEIESILREPKLQERFTEYTRQLRSKAVVDIRI